MSAKHGEASGNVKKHAAPHANRLEKTPRPIKQELPEAKGIGKEYYSER
ncbi:MAG: hypothetical protein P4M13_12020 [Alphaproteobacteria bacterium]|nr:hypothetical protein [Alphaproteobacteria bacterium]